MALPDYVFTEGYDKYGPVGVADFTTRAAQGEWNTYSGNAGGLTIVNSLVGPGYAARFATAGNPNAFNGFTKNLPASYARAIGGFCFSSAFGNGPVGITLYDSGTAQVSVVCNGSGFIEVRRGDNISTVIATTLQSVSINTVHWVEYDITIHNTTGIIKIWLDGIATSINLTGQNTRVSSNNSYNQFANTCRAASGFSHDATFDHLYLWCYTASGGSETPALTNWIIETQTCNADDTSNWSIGAHAIQNEYDNRTNNAPGANQLALEQVTADASGNITGLAVLPAGTSATAKFKAVIYANNAGAPDTLLATGTEVTGCTAGTLLDLPLSSPFAVTSGTIYWFGYITDTSVSLYANSKTTGYKKANTYASGPPSPAGSGFTTGQATWLMLAKMSGVTTHYTQLDDAIPLDDLSYNVSSTATQEDLMGFPALSVTPAVIYSVAVKGRIAKSDSGARTIDLRTKSGATTSSGNVAGQAPSLTYQYLSSYFLTDPNTSAAWTGTLSGVKHGIKVAS